MSYKEAMRRYNASIVRKSSTLNKLRKLSHSLTFVRKPARTVRKSCQQRCWIWWTAKANYIISAKTVARCCVRSP